MTDKRDAEIARLTQERDSAIATISGMTAKYNNLLAERDAAIARAAEATGFADGLEKSLDHAAADRDRAIAERDDALAVIGELQKLAVNVRYWIAHGHSETAIKALNEAMADGWAVVGYKRC